MNHKDFKKMFDDSVESGELEKITDDFLYNYQGGVFKELLNKGDNQMTWYEVLEKISNTKGKAKQQVLKDNESDLLKDILVFLYDDRITTGISKKKLNKKIKTTDLYTLETVELRVKFIMDYLKKHNTGKDEDIEICKSILQMANQDEQLWLEKLIIKDMKIGLTKTTINKVFPNLIYDFTPMRLTKYSSELLPKENIVMPKLDGNYCCVYSDGEQVKYIARSGKEYEGLNHLDKYFIDIPGVYFGEIILQNHFEEHTKDFQKSNAILNSKGDKTKLGIALFDMYEENRPFAARYHHLEELFVYSLGYDYYSLTSPYSAVSVVPDIAYDVDEKELFNIFNGIKEYKLEGLVIYDCDNIWKPKRVKDILKLKGAYSCDLKVLNVFEHKNGNKLGGIIVEYKGNELKVGSGFDDYDRDYYWNNKDEIIGKIVEVEYFTTSKNKEGVESLRHPVFKRIRKDKTDISYD